VARRIWRLRERARRMPVETTGTRFTGWDKHATERPTSCMRVTKVAGGLVLQPGHNRHLARSLSVVPPPYRIARDVPLAWCTDGQRSSGARDDSDPPLPAARASPALVGRRPPADARPDHEPPPGTRARSAQRPGPEPPSPRDCGSAGRDAPWALVGWASRSPAAHPSGAAMGRPVCRQVC
jgi:hypothetical protein